MNEFLNDDLLEKRRVDTEGSFTERKTSSDTKGWLKTVVAFTNSIPVGYPAVLFVGVQTNGKVYPTMKDVNLDTLRQTFSDCMKQIHPPAYSLQKGMRDADGLPYLAVIVPGSLERPHFSGAAFIRLGSRTVDASDEQLTKLVEQRQSKVYVLMQHVGKQVSLCRSSLSNAWRFGSAELVDVNAFYATIRVIENRVGGYHLLVQGRAFSLPLGEIAPSWDHEKDRLAVIIETASRDLH